MPNFLRLNPKQLENRPNFRRILGDEKGVPFALWIGAEIVVVGDGGHHLELQLLGASDMAKELSQTLGADDKEPSPPPPSASGDSGPC